MALRPTSTGQCPPARWRTCQAATFGGLHRPARRTQAARSCQLATLPVAASSEKPSGEPIGLAVKPLEHCDLDAFDPTSRSVFVSHGDVARTWEERSTALQTTLTALGQGYVYLCSAPLPCLVHWPGLCWALVGCCLLLRTLSLQETALTSRRVL